MCKIPYYRQPNGELIDLEKKLEEIAAKYRCVIIFNDPNNINNKIQLSNMGEATKIYLSAKDCLNPDLLIASFFHEIGHTLQAFNHTQFIQQRLLCEMIAWQLGFKEMNKNGFDITHEMVESCLNKLSSYIDYSWKELSWEDCLKELIIIKKEG